jgi:hypothetical protein
MLRNNASRPESKLPGRILAGLLRGTHRNRPSGRPKAGRRAEFGVFTVAVRPKSGPEGRFPARRHYCVKSGNDDALSSPLIAASTGGPDEWRRVWDIGPDRKIAAGQGGPPPTDSPAALKARMKIKAKFSPRIRAGTDPKTPASRRQMAVQTFPLDPPWGREPITTLKII